MSTKRGLLLRTGSSHIATGAEGGEIFKTGDEIFDSMFRTCIASPEIQSQIKQADGLRGQLIRFKETWVGNVDMEYLELDENNLILYIHYSVPNRAYHIGEDRPLDDPEDFKAVVRAFFADLQALVEAIEQTLGKDRYVGVSPKERARREKLDRKLLAYIDEIDKISPAAVKKLIDQGADPGAVLNDIDTALMLACQNDYHEVVKILLDAGAPMDARKLYGVTALMDAAENCSVRSVEVLLKHGAEATTVDENGQNALMYAAGEGSPTGRHENLEKQARKMFKLLIDAGIDINAMDDDGETSLSKAEGKDRQLFAKLLKSLGAER